MPCLCMRFVFCRKPCMRRGHFMKVQTATSYVSGDLNDFVSPLASLYDSLPHHAACPSDSIVHVNPVLPQPRIYMPHSGRVCRTPDVTSQAEWVGAAVLERILAKWWSFTNHTYKNIIVLCMHVCLGAWWAHGSWRPGESRFGSGIFGRLIGHVSRMYFFDVG